MNMKKMLTMLSLASLGIFFTMIASGSTYDDAVRDKVMVALNYSVKQAKFTAKSIQDGYSVRHFQDFDADGNLLQREEINQPDHRTLFTINLQNAQGKFQIDSVAVIKNEMGGFGSFLHYMYVTGSVIVSCNTSFTVDTTTYNGIPCDKITAVLLASTMELAKALGIPESIILENPDSFPNRAVFIIGQEVPFVYSVQVYNSKGRLLSGIELTDVDLNPILAPSLFELPKDLEIKIVRTDEDVEKIYAEAPQENAPRSGSLSSTIRTLVIIIVALLAALLIGIVIRKKRRI